MGKCFFIAAEVKIPQIFAEEEGQFLDQLYRSLSLNRSGRIFHYKNNVGKIITLNYSEIFTGQWDFVDIPKDTWG
jgi:hypothetical protein